MGSLISSNTLLALSYLHLTDHTILFVVKFQSEEDGEWPAHSPKGEMPYDFENASTHQHSEEEASEIIIKVEPGEEGRHSDSSNDFIAPQHSNLEFNVPQHNDIGEHKHNRSDTSVPHHTRNAFCAPQHNSSDFDDPRQNNSEFSGHQHTSDISELEHNGSEFSESQQSGLKGTAMGDKWTHNYIFGIDKSLRDSVSDITSHNLHKRGGTTSVKTSYEEAHAALLIAVKATLDKANAAPTEDAITKYMKNLEEKMRKVKDTRTLLILQNKIDQLMFQASMQAWEQENDRKFAYPTSQSDNLDLAQQSNGLGPATSPTTHEIGS